MTMPHALVGAQSGHRLPTRNPLHQAQVAELHAAALAEDAAIFDYDSHHDAIQEVGAASALWLGFLSWSRPPLTNLSWPPLAPHRHAQSLRSRRSCSASLATSQAFSVRHRAGCSCLQLQHHSRLP